MENPIVDVPLPIKQHYYQYGILVVSLSALDLQRVENISQCTLIAKFSRGRPYMDIIRDRINAKKG